MPLVAAQTIVESSAILVCGYTPEPYGTIANTRAGKPEPPFGFGKPRKTEISTACKTLSMPVC
jgi:hypothetical protein